MSDNTYLTDQIAEAWHLLKRARWDLEQRADANATAEWLNRNVEIVGPTYDEQRWHPGREPTSDTDYARARANAAEKVEAMVKAERELREAVGQLATVTHITMDKLVAK